ncbi:MAG: hypothetical protein P4L70_12210 [Parasulfuritortus sp.]|nr:hypothetical protein [Parasulfuritortus sp.]
MIRLAGWLVFLIALSSAGCALAAGPEMQSAATLQAQYAALGERLNHSPFRRALILDSSDSSGHLQGDLYALVDYPFATVAASLSGPGQWCDVLILHLNTKYCRATVTGAGAVLTVRIGKKYPELLGDAYPVAFAYRLASKTSNFLDIRLNADTGPLSTHDYLIQLAAIPVTGSRTFLHLTYSYAYGLTGQLAMNTYLATIGRDKVGFTLTGKQSNGLPDYIGGERGLIERNTMRYYLAIDSYLGSLAALPRDRFEKSLQSWFAATEKYPRQLHELDKTDYLNMKRSEYLRQQQPPQ